MHPPDAVAQTRPPLDARSCLRSFRSPLVLVALFFGLFSLVRLLILEIYRDDFASLSGRETFLAFARGLRFDAAIIFLFLGPVLFLISLPFRWSRSALWQTFWHWTAFVLFIVFAVLLWVDAIYFGYVHRHAGPEVTMAGDAAAAVAHSGIRQYGLHFVAFLVLAGALALGWRRLLGRPEPSLGRPAWEIPTCIVLGVLMYFAARGSVTGKRLKVVHAFESGSQPAAYLSLNGPFAILHSVDTLRHPRSEFYAWDDAARTVRGCTYVPEELTLQDDFPLFRRRKGKDGPKPNVVLFMIESWDANWCDVYRRELGLPPAGLTPNFDELCTRGVRFNRFYAAGQRSVDGLASLLCGFPNLPDTPYLGRGMEQSRLSFLGTQARREGYATYFIQSSDRESFRCDAISKLGGFETYIASEDIPPAPGGPPRKGLGRSCWDHEMFQEAHRRFAAAREPFLAFVYTACTHTPFAWPDPKWEKFPSDSLEGRYKNSLAYADGAIGEFFALARGSGYYNNTIFILTADHIGGPSGQLGNPPSLHHIPCLIIAPGLAPGTDNRIGGQLDVIPTIAALAGWSAPYAALGHSLFEDTEAPRGAFCVEGPVIVRIEDGGIVSQDLNRRVFERKLRPDGDLDAIEHRLLSQVEVALTLLRQNRIAPTDGQTSGR